MLTDWLDTTSCGFCEGTWWNCSSSAGVQGRSQHSRWVCASVSEVIGAVTRHASDRWYQTGIALELTPAKIDSLPYTWLWKQAACTHYEKGNELGSERPKSELVKVCFRRSHQTWVIEIERANQERKRKWYPKLKQGWHDQMAYFLSMDKLLYDRLVLRVKVHLFLHIEDVLLVLIILILFNECLISESMDWKTLFCTCFPLSVTRDLGLSLVTQDFGSLTSHWEVYIKAYEFILNVDFYLMGRNKPLQFRFRPYQLGPDHLMHSCVQCSCQDATETTQDVEQTTVQWRTVILWRGETIAYANERSSPTAQGSY